ncbi:hypothetical protein [Candidatus Odyssella thessalonicensis]|uniref:hypothetical protein n=1 Tax=Candidatus Odyssella thessalonicensis TaxID=84647 RepID=UPI003CCA9412
MGENCFILDKNTLQPGVTIGNNVILWSGNHIGHHSHIDDHTFIASHVVISGSVQVGKNCFFGVNTTIGDNLKIGDFTVVGAGAMVLKGVGGHSLIVRKSEALSERSSHRLRGL